MGGERGRVAGKNTGWGEDGRRTQLLVQLPDQAGQHEQARAVCGLCTHERELLE